VRQSHAWHADRCGIFGYYTHDVPKDLQHILNTLFNGLKRLEYRGYDSAGVAVDLVDVYPASSRRSLCSRPLNGASSPLAELSPLPDVGGSRYGQPLSPVAETPERNGHSAMAAAFTLPFICKEVGKVKAEGQAGPC
jgi:hypothetical protein